MLNLGTIFATLKIFNEMSPELKSAGYQLANLGQGLTQAGILMSGFTLAIGAAAVETVQAGKDFEYTTAKLVALAGVTKEELEGVRQHLLDMAPAVAIGPGKLAEAMYIVSSTMQDTKVALEVLDVASKGAAVGMGEAKDVAGALVAIINSYGKENITAARAGDILTRVIRDGGAEAHELAPRLAKVIPFAAQLGVTFEEVGANLATMTKLGVPASQAVTSLASVFAALARAVPRGQRALAEVGMTYAGLRAEIKEKGLTEAMIRLKETFKDNEEGLIDVVGRLEAFKNVLGTTGPMAETYRQVLERTKNSQGELADSFAIVSKTQKFMWDSLMASVEKLWIELSSALMPIFKSVIDTLRAMMPYLNQLVVIFGAMPMPIKLAAVALLAIVAAIGPLLIYLGMLGMSIGYLTRGMAFFSKEAVKTVAANAAIGASAAAATPPIVAMNAAIATSGIQMRNAKGQFMSYAATQAAMGTSTQVAGSNALAFSGILAKMGSGLKTAGGLVLDLGGKFAKFAFLNPFGMILTALTSLISYMRWITGSWDFILQPLKDIWTIVKDDLTPAFDAWDVAVERVGNRFEWLRIRLNAAWEIAKIINPSLRAIYGDLNAEAEKIRKTDSLAALRKGGFGELTTSAQDQRAAALARLKAAGLSTGVNSRTAFPDPIVPPPDPGDLKAIEEMTKLIAKLSGKTQTQEIEKLATVIRALGMGAKMSAIELYETSESLSKMRQQGQELPDDIDKIIDRFEQNKKGWASFLLIIEATKDAQKSGIKITQEYLDKQIATGKSIVEARQSEFDAAMKIAADLSEKQTKASMQSTDYAIREAERWKTETLKRIEPLKKGIPGAYKWAADNVEYEFQRMIEAARNMVDMTTKEMARLKALKELSTTLDDLADAFSKIAHNSSGKFSTVVQGIANIISSWNLATKAAIAYAEATTLAAKAAAMASGVASVLQATGSGSTTSRAIGGALAGGQLGSMVGSIFGPMGVIIGGYIGEAAGAMMGIIRSVVSKARSAVVKYGESFAGGFDGLRESLLVLGDEGERLWIKFTQQSKSASAAAAAFKEITAALEAYKTSGKGLAESTYKTRAELQLLADNAKKAYDYMLASGLYTIESLADAWKAYEEAQRRALGDPNANAIDDIVAGFPTRAELEQAAANAEAAYIRIRDSGLYTAATVEQAFLAWQDAMVAAGDAGTIAMKKIDDEIKSLTDSIADEAPEEVMGVIETAARARIAALEAEKAIALISIAEQKTAKELAADAAQRSADMSYLHAKSQAITLDEELRRIFSKGYIIPIGFRLPDGTTTSSGYQTGAGGQFPMTSGSGGGSSTSGDQTIVVQVGEDVLIRKVVRGMPKYLKLIGAQ